MIISLIAALLGAVIKILGYLGKKLFKLYSLRNVSKYYDTTDVKKVVLPVPGGPIMSVTKESEMHDCSTAFNCDWFNNLDKFCNILSFLTDLII